MPFHVNSTHFHTIPHNTKTISDSRSPQSSYTGSYNLAHIIVLTSNTIFKSYYSIVTQLLLTRLLYHTSLNLPGVKLVWNCGISPRNWFYSIPFLIKKCLHSHSSHIHFSKCEIPESFQIQYLPSSQPLFKISLQVQALAVLPPAPALSSSVPPSLAALEQDDAAFLPQLDVNFPVYYVYVWCWDLNRYNYPFRNDIQVWTFYNEHVIALLFGLCSTEWDSLRMSELPSQNIAVVMSLWPLWCNHNALILFRWKDGRVSICK